MNDNRNIVLMISKGDNDPVGTVASIGFCESSISICFGTTAVHIPWSEIAKWQAWLADRVEQEA